MKFAVKISLAAVLLFAVNCKKKDTSAKEEEPKITTVVISTTLPGVSTNTIVSITSQNAICKATVSSEGSSALTAVGVCWDSVPGPTTLRDHDVIGVGTGTFNCYLSGLRPNTTYYARAFATNASGTSYGEEIQFTTKDSWNLAGLASKQVYALLNSGNGIFAGADDGLYLSTDEGLHWTTASSGMPAFTGVYGLAKSSSYLYAGTYTGLFRSGDNGASWSLLNTGVVDPYIYAVAASGTTVFVLTSSFGLRVSYDDGNTWKSGNTGIPSVSNITSIGFNGSEAYAGLTNTGIYKSTDGGDSWTPVSAGLPNSINFFNFGFSGNNVLAATSSGVYIKAGSPNWTQAGGVSYMASSFATDGNTVYAGGYGGVFVSLNNGSSFTENSAGLTSVVTAVACNASYAFAGGNGVFRIKR